MELRRILFWIVMLSMFGFFTKAGAADCTTQLIGTAEPCDGCTYELVLGTRRDENCTASPTSMAMRTSALAYLDSRIVVRAKHGVAGTNGNAIAYSPNKGYVGSDDFVVQKVYELNGRTSKFKIHYTVTVH
jgi:hypothetical protein